MNINGSGKQYQFTIEEKYINGDIVFVVTNIRDKSSEELEAEQRRSVKQSETTSKRDEPSPRESESSITSGTQQSDTTSRGDGTSSRESGSSITSGTSSRSSDYISSYVPSMGDPNAKRRPAPLKAARAKADTNATRRRQGRRRPKVANIAEGFFSRKGGGTKKRRKKRHKTRRKK